MAGLLSVTVCCEIETEGTGVFETDCALSMKMLCALPQLSQAYEVVTSAKSRASERW